jgi:hypothetical protein
MKRDELRNRLTKLGVPSYSYNLDGKGRDDERLCLGFTNNEWSVYYIERGEKTTNKIFMSEEEACQFIYEQLYKRYAGEKEVF